MDNNFISHSPIVLIGDYNGETEGSQTVSFDNVYGTDDVEDDLGCSFVSQYPTWIDYSNVANVTCVEYDVTSVLGYAEIAKQQSLGAALIEGLGHFVKEGVNVVG